MPNFSEMLNTNTQKLWPTASQGSMASSINPTSTQTGLEQTPPKSPEDLQQRVGAWQGFMQRMQTDPTLQQAVLMTGAQMLAGPQFMGENTGSIIGRALQTGIQSHQMGKAAEAKRALEEREALRADTLTQSQIGALEANTERTKQQTSEDLETKPIRQKRLSLEQQAAELTLGQQPELFRSQLATAESQRARNYALAEKAKRPGGTGSPSTASELARLYEIANPGASEQDIANLVLAHNKKAEKGSGATDTARLTTLRALYENATTGEEQAMYQGLIHQALDLPGIGASAGGDTPITETEFRAAAKKAGPDGRFILRGKEYKLKPGVIP